MANITASSDVGIAMTDEEKEIIKNAYSIMHDISNELWRIDADYTEAFGNLCTACDCIQMFMKNETGIILD